MEKGSGVKGNHKGIELFCNIGVFWRSYKLVLGRDNSID